MGDSYREELKKRQKGVKAKASQARGDGGRTAAQTRSKAIAWQQSRMALRDKAKQAKMRLDAI